MTDHKQVSFLMSNPNSERLTVLAKRAGVNRSVMLEALIENVELDENGIPTWWPADQYPRTEETLPLKP